MGNHLTQSSEETLTRWEFQRKVAEFVLSNAASIGIIIYQITSLKVCFDGNEDEDVVDDDDDENAAAVAKNRFLAALIIGLLVEITPIIFLSATYGSLLDVRSAHKTIDYGDDRGNCRSRFIARVFVPCGMGLVGILMGYVSIEYGFKKSCNGNSGSASSYLALVAGIFSVFAGLFILAFYISFSPCSCHGCNGAQNNCCESCCRRITGYVKGMFKFVWAAHTMWQLAGVVMSYRSGTFSVGIAWIVAFLTVCMGWRATLAGLIVIAIDAEFVTVLT